MIVLLIILLLMTEIIIQLKKKKNHHEDFPGGPLTKNPSFKSGGLGLIPGQGTRFHIPQLKAHMLKLKSCLSQLRLKIPYVPTKTQWSQMRK